MYRTALIACAALVLCACNSTGRDPVIVDTNSRPFDPCPVEGLANVEQTPKDPLSGVDRAAAMVAGLPEDKAVAALKYDQVDMPGHANRLRSRLTTVQDWCKARKP